MNSSEFATLAQFLSGLSLAELSQRLNIPELTLQEMSKTSDFAEWSQRQDPDSVSWKIHRNRRDKSECYLPNLSFS